MGGKKNNGDGQKQEVVPNSAKEMWRWNSLPAQPPSTPPHALKRKQFHVHLITAIYASRKRYT